MKSEIISASAADTIALGRTWGEAAQSGLLIGLTGNLGAGKTQLVKGLAQGLGWPDRVHSPTFSLVNEYAGGRLPLFHLDLYRLETRAEIVAAGLEEYFSNQPGVVVVEWYERWPLPTDPPPVGPARLVCFEILDENSRRISHEDFGA